MKKCVQVVVGVYIVATFVIGVNYWLHSEKNKDTKIADLIPGATPQQLAELSAYGTDWVKDAAVYSINDYTIAVPKNTTGSPSPDILIWKQGNLFVSSIPGIGTHLYNPGVTFDISNYIVTIQDWDKDKQYDSIYYSAINRKKKIKTEIMDRDFDGTPDTKIETDSKGMRYYSFIESKWELNKPKKQ